MYPIRIGMRHVRGWKLPWRFDLICFWWSGGDGTGGRGADADGVGVVQWGVERVDSGGFGDGWFGYFWEWRSR